MSKLYTIITRNIDKLSVKFMTNFINYIFMCPSTVSGCVAKLTTLTAVETTDSGKKSNKDLLSLKASEESMVRDRN